MKEINMPSLYQPWRVGWHPLQSVELVDSAYYGKCLWCMKRSDVFFNCTAAGVVDLSICPECYAENVREAEV